MIEWGDRSRPVARWIPQAIVRVFDKWADWMDGKVFVIRSYSLRGEGERYPAPILYEVERWDVANVIFCIVLSICYAIWLGSWKGLLFGSSMYVFGWMAFRWFI